MSGRVLDMLIAAPVEWLHRLPDVVWGALTGAGIAFISTLLSNRNSRWQLRMQLDHSAKQEDRKRSLDLRRDVYLPAAEAIAKAQNAIGRMMDLDEDVTTIRRDMTASLAGLGKIQLVASESTVTALMNFQATLVPTFLEVTWARMPLDNTKKLIALQQTYMDAALSEHKRVVQLMKEHAISGRQDQALMDRLNAQCDKELKLFKIHATKQGELRKQLASGLLNLYDRYAGFLRQTTDLIPEIVLAARLDLDQPINADAYRGRFKEQQDGAIRVLGEFGERARQSLNDNNHGTDPPGEEA